MLQCPVCGAENSDHNNFCRDCGAAMERSVKAPYQENSQPPAQQPLPPQQPQYQQPPPQYQQPAYQQQLVYRPPMQQILINPGDPITPQMLQTQRFMPQQKFFGDQPIIRAGAILVFIQNILLLSLFSTNFNLIQIVLFLDVIGFSLLGGGLLKLSRDQPHLKTNLQIGGGFMIGWVIFRLLWQLPTIGLIGFRIEDPEDFVAYLDSFLFVFMASAICLAIAGFYLTTDNVISSTFLAYTIVNAIATFLLISLDLESIILGVFLKLLVVPILGIIAFFQIFNRF